MTVLVVGSFNERVKREIEGIFPEAWQLHIAAEPESARRLPEAEVLIPEHSKVDAGLLELAPRLRLVQTGAGYDNVDIAACAARGISVCCAAGVNAGAVAEHVMALMLAFFKNIPYLDSCMKSRADAGGIDYRGGELAGRTMGVIGLGGTGSRTAALCLAFGMRVLGCSRRGLAPPGVEPVSLEELLRLSDVVSVHVPLTAQTRRLLSAASFELMRPGVLLINTSRGAVIDEAALTEALARGRIAGACLDVFEHEPLSADSPLRDMPNVLLTPHTAGLPDGPGFHAGRYRFFRRNIEKFLSNQIPDCLIT